MTNTLAGSSSVSVLAHDELGQRPPVRDSVALLDPLQHRIGQVEEPVAVTEGLELKPPDRELQLPELGTWNVLLGPACPRTSSSSTDPYTVFRRAASVVRPTPMTADSPEAVPIQRWTSRSVVGPHRYVAARPRRVDERGSLPHVQGAERRPARSSSLSP